MSQYWFKRKRYGYGWTPTTPQGWLVIGIYLVFVIAFSLVLGEQPTFETITVYTCLILMATMTLLLVTRLKAPPGKWRWGQKPSDNPEEDW